MDFLKGLIVGLDDDGEEVDEKSTGAVFDEANAFAGEISRKLIERSKQWSNKGDFFKASLFLFTVGWAIVGHLYGGIEHAEKRKGKRNQVSRLWHLLRIAFCSGEMDRTMTKLMTFDQDFDEGKFDEVH